MTTKHVASTNEKKLVIVPAQDLYRLGFVVRCDKDERFSGELFKSIEKRLREAPAALVKTKRVTLCADEVRVGKQPVLSVELQGSFGSGSMPGVFRD